MAYGSCVIVSDTPHRASRPSEIVFLSSKIDLKVPDFEGVDFKRHTTHNIRNRAKWYYYRDKILTLPVSWYGTFVAMRIKKGIQNFSLYSYV
jgi:hypothetical protein